MMEPRKLPCPLFVLISRRVVLFNPAAPRRHRTSHRCGQGGGSGKGARPHHRRASTRTASGRSFLPQARRGGAGRPRDWGCAVIAAGTTAIPGDVRDRVLDRLAATGGAENVRVLLGVESGSRAWGFPSPDSAGGQVRRQGAGRRSSHCRPRPFHRIRNPLRRAVSGNAVSDGFIDELDILFRYAVDPGWGRAR